MELGAHARAGFDGDDVGAARAQEAGGDARAGADVEDAAAVEGRAGQFLERLEELRRIVGAGGGVLSGYGVEGKREVGHDFIVTAGSDE